MEKKGQKNYLRNTVWYEVMIRDSLDSMPCMPEVKYSRDDISLEELTEFVINSASSFTPPLDTIVDIDEYCRKIIDKAVILIAHEGKTIAGLHALYCNDHVKKRGFGTYIFVKPEYRGMGIAEGLARKTVETARSCGMKSFVVETHEKNKIIHHILKSLGV